MFNKSPAPSSQEQDKTERLICFTLATLSYLETLLVKLNSLFKLFPSIDCNIESSLFLIWCNSIILFYFLANEFINLGFEDISINVNDETQETVDIPVTIQNQPNSKRFSITESSEIIDLKK